MGMFWEAVNAAGVLGIPMMVSIWDDGYGISVPNEVQITKGDLSAILSGFRRAPGTRQGYDLYTVQGWDYPGLCETYLNAAQILRTEHVPAVVHVVEMTQPQGHSTSGSHKRYKTAERLAWEEEFDGLRKMREWMLAQGIASAAEIEGLERLHGSDPGGAEDGPRDDRRPRARVHAGRGGRGGPPRAGAAAGAAAPRRHGRAPQRPDRHGRGGAARGPPPDRVEEGAGPH